MYIDLEWGANELQTVLILGGANVHCKIVDAANEMGCRTIVTDYLVNSPAKQIADKGLMYSITDVESIVQECTNLQVNGVLSTHLDPGQRPYQAICERLGLPCYGTKSQFHQMTDKQAFKELCKQYGVGTITDYSISDIENDHVEYPVFVKPVDSRGSRGQAVCTNREETLRAIQIARKESSNGECIIEKYMAGAAEVQVTYFFINGEAYLIRTADSYRGSEEEGLEKVVVCSVSPSRYNEEYLKTTHPKVVAMLKGLGLQNGPAFMQGFYDHGVFRFFDPGLRFPGVEYEKIYKSVFQIDFMKMMVEFSLHNGFTIDQLPSDLHRINGMRAAILFPTVGQGIISSVAGVEEINAMPEVISYSQRHTIGGKTTWTYDVNQRMAEIEVLSEDTEQLREAIKKIQKCYHVYDEHGNEMMYAPFNTSRIEE